MFGSDLPISTSSITPELINLWVVAAVIRRGDLILAAKRLESGPSGLKSEFPSGKVEVGETPRQALVREIDEEHSLEVETGDEVGTFVSPPGKYSIQLHCFWCTVARGNAVLRMHSEVRWCTLDELVNLD
jgi:8-oxo-dGTP diphosphatase